MWLRRRRSEGSQGTHGVPQVFGPGCGPGPGLFSAENDASNKGLMSDHLGSSCFIL